MTGLRLLSSLALAAVYGCQTRITAERFPETAVPIVTAAGTNGVIVLSGGWYVTARSPLWATEAIKGLDVGTDGKGAVYLRTADYSRDLSSNAAVISHNLVADFVSIADKVAAAYLSTGKAMGAEDRAAISLGIASYSATGGDPVGATVALSEDACTISDGNVTRVCRLHSER